MYIKRKIYNVPTYEKKCSGPILLYYTIPWELRILIKKVKNLLYARGCTLVVSRLFIRYSEV